MHTYYLSNTFLKKDPNFDSMKQRKTNFFDNGFFNQTERVYEIERKLSDPENILINIFPISKFFFYEIKFERCYTVVLKL